MTFNEFATPPDRRYYEDYIPGHVHNVGSVTVTEEAIIAFANLYDPQYFHNDPERAKDSRFGGLVASGWQTTVLAMRMYIERFLPTLASLASPGVDEVRWPNPVRPGDTLSLQVTILDARPSRNKTDRGVVRARMEAFNQRGEPVLSLIGISILGRRPS